MTATVRLNDEIIKKAKMHAKIEHRSTAKQIEYWAKLGQIAEQNPDLPISFIKDTLIAIQEVKNQDTKPFKLD